ncbi:coiled-coil-helix-coiled-coil-helix domain containing 3a isoform X4 [Oncorhynchus keta]|uniref:coiled-coil-helix-coiled-coil-helix domain containing 3a isoform X1 n=1 Tax=Oncorhynchus keta TaxID=8018 RepID=UPI00227C4259|nr:coiled-coil-helix-coiled-coil-helix domain containing 3a isoform X1 [Oncorhynchus keta]XP_052373188.1 coiled-coil-helix-coiled-coil-helix domain containing 3a isoform X3 [Oncorhynchus keta]XP_052373189.1 coiled-coil-helix-coiled-coil-helix domain containing 3a isoform X4 [Oncorhynchus keta]
MGANNSRRRVSFESDENDNITVVKGIRLSENVINRMREPIAPLLPPSLPQVPPPVAAPSSLLIPVPPLRPPFDPITSLPPIEPIALPPQPPAPVTEVVAPPPPPMEQVAAPTIIDMVIPPPTLAALKPAASPPPPASVEQPTVKPIAPPPPPAEFIAPTPCEPIAPPPQPPVEAFAPPPAPVPVEVVGPPLPPPTPEPEPVAVAPPAAHAVDEEKLRKKITEDLQKCLLKERVKAEQELQAWLEEEKVHAASFAEAEAQASVKDEVGRILELERATTHNTLTQAVMREKVSAEDERLRTQLYAKQLELRDQELKKQDAFYREQVARLEDRSAQFYKLSTENYHKAADGINAKFKSYTETQPKTPNCKQCRCRSTVARKNSLGRNLERNQALMGGQSSSGCAYNRTWPFKARFFFKMFIDDQQGEIIITVVEECATGQYLRSKCHLAFHSRAFRG